MKIHVGVARYKYGVNVFAGRTLKELYAKIYVHVTKVWNDFCEGQEIPKNHKKALSMYFEATDGEEYLDVASDTVKCVCGR